MANYIVITENDESQWDDQTGVKYHYPPKYKGKIKEGTIVVYYKGRIKDVAFQTKGCPMNLIILVLVLLAILNKSLGPRITLQQY